MLQNQGVGQAFQTELFALVVKERAVNKLIKV
jgi:hypothetical protein